jgi:hypothetical protein
MHSNHFGGAIAYASNDDACHHWFNNVCMGASVAAIPTGALLCHLTSPHLLQAGADMTFILTHPAAVPTLRSFSPDMIATPMLPASPMQPVSGVPLPRWCESMPPLAYPNSSACEQHVNISGSNNTIGSGAVPVSD